MSESFKLYSWSVSLYSARARAYLIKQGIKFDDISPASKEYNSIIRPAIGRWIIPVMTTPDGEIVQDGIDIIDWFESRQLAPLPAYPTTPRQLITALVMDMFGGEGLLRPAMHYRWNFDADNLSFITQQFGLFALPHLPPAERADMALHASNRMRKAAVSFGVTPETAPAIEAAYLETLGELNDHFSAYPYLLGGVPSVGDYGLFASLFAHLGRDPHPLRLMQERAPMVFRWTERMRNPSADMVEFFESEQCYLLDDMVPPTAEILLKRVATDYLPEIEAMVRYHNDWLKVNEVRAGDIVGGTGMARGIGFCAFDWRDVNVNAVVMPYRVFMLQRIQDAYDALDKNARVNVDALLASTNLTEIVTTRCIRRVERADNREIWGDLNN